LAAMSEGVKNNLSTSPGPAKGGATKEAETSVGVESPAPRWRGEGLAKNHGSQTGMSWAKKGTGVKKKKRG